MSSNSLRGILAADQDLGAGNVVMRLLEHGADPDGPGLTFDVAVDAHPAWTPLTLGQLDERIRARASWLHAHGVGWRDPVAVFGTTSADVILTFMACNRIGAIPALLESPTTPTAT